MVMLTDEKIATYKRTSTPGQELEQTIKTQDDRLSEVYKGRNIVAEYKDEGYSGAYLDRPDLSRLREDARNGVFNVLALYALDRLSRETVDMLILLKEFSDLGIRVEVLGQDLKNTPEGELNYTMVSAIAKYEKSHITQRMMDGKRRKMNNKELIGCRPPFGFNLIRVDREKRKPAEFVINEKEADVVRKMFSIFLVENSIRQTAKRLEAVGVVGRNGKPISIKTIAKWLRSENYIGNHYCNKNYAVEARYHIKDKRKHKLTGRNIRPRKDWKVVEIPHIVEDFIFWKSQEMLDKNKSEYLKPTKYKYLCQGLIKCVRCTRTYFGKLKSLSQRKKRLNGSHFSYICPQRFGVKLGEPHCHSREIGVERLDKIVWKYITDLVSDSEKIKKSVREFQEKREGERGSNRKIYNSLSAEKASIRARKSRILDLYGDEKYNRVDLDEKVLELNSQERTVDKLIRDVEVNLQKIEDAEAVDREIEKFCLIYKDKISNNPTFDFKKYTVRRLIKEINIMDDGRIGFKVRISGVGSEEFIIEEDDAKQDSPFLSSSLKEKRVLQDTPPLLRRRGISRF